MKPADENSLGFRSEFNIVNGEIKWGYNQSVAQNVSQSVAQNVSQSVVQNVHQNPLDVIKNLIKNNPQVTLKEMANAISKTVKTLQRLIKV